MKITANLVPDATQIRADALREAALVVSETEAEAIEDNGTGWASAAYLRATAKAILALIDHPPPDLRLHAVSVEPDAGGARDAPGVSGLTAAQLREWAQALEDAVQYPDGSGPPDGWVEHKEGVVFAMRAAADKMETPNG